MQASQSYATETTENSFQLNFEQHPVAPQLLQQTNERRLLRRILPESCKTTNPVKSSICDNLQICTAEETTSMPLIRNTAAINHKLPTITLTTDNF